MADGQAKFPTSSHATWDDEMARRALADRFDAVSLKAATTSQTMWATIDIRCGVDWAWGSRCHVPYDRQCLVERARFVACAERVMQDHGISKR